MPVWHSGMTPLIETLPPLSRLALAYAPRRARADWLALLALDARLALLVRSAHDPILAQIKLAWWRDRFTESSAKWPRGEPLLALLHDWNEASAALCGLVDGWELLLGEAPLPKAAMRSWAKGRAGALAALATRVGAGAFAAQAAMLAQSWALADLAAHLGHPEEQATARELADQHRANRITLPRSMRPLAVLHGLAVRPQSGVIALLTSIRLGIIGR